MLCSCYSVYDERGEKVVYGEDGGEGEENEWPPHRPHHHGFKPLRFRLYQVVVGGRVVVVGASVVVVGARDDMVDLYGIVVVFVVVVVDGVHD